MRETLISAGGGWKLLDVSELWRYRDLMLLLARRDVAVRYRQAALGVLWALLQPLGMVAVFTLVLGRLARIPSDGFPYAVFVLAAWLPWNFFSQAVNSAGNSVIGNPNLVTKVYFPRLVIPIASLGAPAVDLLVASLLMVAVLLWQGIGIGPGVLLLPLLFVVMGATALGVGALVAALTVSYRDFRHLTPFVTTLWMWLTPVLYPLSAIPEQWRWIVALNPLTGVVSAIRSAWLGQPLDWIGVGVSASLAAVLLLAGVAYFRQVERRFADVV